MKSPVIECGRCGAENPQDAEFCASCGALMAAYQSPAGATDTLETLTRPAEATPATETVYTLPRAPEFEPVEIKTEPITVAATEIPEPVVVPPNPETVRPVEVASGDTPSDERSTEAVPATAPVNPGPDHVHPSLYPYTPPTVPPAPPAGEAQRPPAPAIFRTLFGEYADDIYYPADVSGPKRYRGSPHSLILAGLAAFMVACLAAAAATSNGVVFLLIGGPLACSLIAIGVLLLVGRYPTGRP